MTRQQTRSKLKRSRCRRVIAWRSLTIVKYTDLITLNGQAKRNMPVRFLGDMDLDKYAWPEGNKYRRAERLAAG